MCEAQRHRESRRGNSKGKSRLNFSCVASDHPKALIFYPSCILHTLKLRGGYVKKVVIVVTAEILRRELGTKNHHHSALKSGDESGDRLKKVVMEKW